MDGPAPDPETPADPEPEPPAETIQPAGGGGAVEESKAQQVDARDLDAEEDEDDDEPEEEEDGGDVQLGVAVPLDPDEPHPFHSHDWREWDGGALGGRPVWLHPAAVPSLACTLCEAPMTLVMQLYAPLDEPAEAFHRMLYVFCCADGRCVARGSVAALRAQLPQDNAYFPGALGDDEDAPAGWAAHLPETHGATQCRVCGQRAASRCTRCRQAWYCCRAHQRDDWKAGHKQECSGGARPAGKSPRSRFPLWAVEVDAEPAAAPLTAEERAMLAQAESGEVDLAQSDVPGILGSRVMADAAMRAFQLRVAREPRQVVRYCRERPRPLWPAKEPVPTADDVPACGACGAPRAFEFQVMPQALHFLGVDEATVVAAVGDAEQRQPPDWGTLAVYTCSASCAADVGAGAMPYVQEFVWRQS